MTPVEVVAIVAAVGSIIAGVLSTVQFWSSAASRNKAERHLVTSVLEGTNGDMRRYLLEMGAQLERQPGNEKALHELRQFIVHAIATMNKLEQQQIVGPLEQPSKRGQVNYTLKLFRKIEDRVSV